MSLKGLLRVSRCLLPLLLLFTTKPAFSDEKIEEIISYTPEALEFSGVDADTLKDLTDFSIHLDPTDYIVYLLENDSETFGIQCHYHSGGGTHCLNTGTDVTLPDSFKEVLSVSGGEIQNFFENLTADPSAMDSSIVPWAFGILASYYFSKKALNYWLHRKFLLNSIKTHDHNHFFIDSGDQLESRIDSVRSNPDQSLQRLKDIKESVLSLSERDENLKSLLNQKLIALASELLKELKNEHAQHNHNHSHGHSCSTCGHHHGSNESEQAFSFSPTQGETSFQTLTMHSSRPVFDSSNLIEDLNLSDSKKAIKEGVIIKFSKALIFDLKNELIDPWVRAVKGVHGIFKNPDHRRQLNSFAQTRYRVFLGETRAAVASTIAFTMASIKVSGETLETMLFGPLHVLCQISDMAALTAGLSMFLTYHCLRQPVRKKNINLLAKRNFWRVFFNRLKNPFKSEMTENDLKTASNGMTVFISEIKKLKKSLDSLIWLLRYDQKLSPQAANVFSVKLGKINKSLENTHFDIDLIGNDLSGEELLEALKTLSPIVESYNNLYTEILSESERANLVNTTPLTCRRLLRAFSPTL